MPTSRSNRVAGTARPRTTRGFTLVELLVVVLIITILIALLIPGVSAVRNSARSASTRALMQSVNAAVTNYRADNDQNLPGVFRQDQLATPDSQQSNTNNMRLTAMENAILDLVGGVVTDEDDANLTFRITGLGGQTREVFVSTSAIAAGDGPGYLDVGDNFFPIEGQVNDPERSLDTLRRGDPQPIPDIVDPFGVPLMLWQRDTFAGKAAPMAAVDARNNLAKFYVNTNRGYFDSSQLGERDARQDRRSVLATGNASDASRESSLRAIVGNPSTPSSQRVANITGGSLTGGALAPALPRGDIVLMSAGNDRIYLDGEGSRGNFQWNSAAYVPSGEYNVNADILSDSKPIDQFDDIIIGGAS